MSELNNKDSLDIFPNDIEEFNLIDSETNNEYKYGKSVLRSLPSKPYPYTPNVTFIEYPVSATFAPAPTLGYISFPTFAPAPTIAYTSSVSSNELASNAVLKVRIDKVLNVTSYDLIISYNLDLHNSASFAMNDKNGNGSRYCNNGYDQNGFVVNNNFLNGSSDSSRLSVSPSESFNIGSYSTFNSNIIYISGINSSSWYYDLCRSCIIIISRRFNKIIVLEYVPDYYGTDSIYWTSIDIANGLNNLCYISFMRTILNGQSVSTLNPSGFISNFMISELISNETYDQEFFKKIVTRYLNNNYRLD